MLNVAALRSGTCGGQWYALRGDAGGCSGCAGRWNGSTVDLARAHLRRFLASSVVLGAGVVSLGDSAECARGAKKPPHTPIISFFKKVTPEQRLREVGTKVTTSGAVRECEREVRKQSDIALSIKGGGQDNARPG